MNACEDNSEEKWFVMRDLHRWNSNHPAWQTLSDSGLEVFTPLQWKVTLIKGHRFRRHVAVIPDLVFVKGSRETLDTIVAKDPLLQYRFVKNCGGRPMTVRETEMQLFIKAVNSNSKVKYYTPDELSSLHKGKKVRIISGPLHGFEGTLLSVRGSKVRRLFVEIPEIVAAAVEVKPEFIEIIE